MCDVRIVHDIIRVLLEKEHNRLPLMRSFALEEIGVPVVHAERVAPLAVDFLIELKGRRLNLSIQMDEVSHEALNLTGLIPCLPRKPYEREGDAMAPSFTCD